MKKSYCTRRAVTVNRCRTSGLFELKIKGMGFVSYQGLAYAHLFSKLPNVPTLTDSLAEKVAYALIWWMCLLVTASEGIDLPVLVSSPFTYCCLFFIDPIPYCLRRCVWSRMCIETDHMSLNVWGSALRLIVGINDLPCTVPVVQLHPCDMFVPLHVRNEKIPCSIWYEGPTHLVRTHVTLERMAFPCL